MATTKFIVQAVQRPGYDGSWRAGRKWPSNAATEIEVLDQDEDPSPEEAAKDKAKGIIRVGRKTFEILREDGHLKMAPAGDPLALAMAAGAADSVRAENERLRAENAELRAQLGQKEPAAPPPGPKSESKAEQRHTRVREG